MSDTLGFRKVFGVLIPYFNSVVQPELDDLRPPGVTNQTARFSLDSTVVDDVKSAAAKLATCGTHALIIALSADSFPAGLTLLGRIAEDIAREVERPVFTASHATHAALERMGAKRISIVTPFDADSNELVSSAFEERGFSVARIAGLDCPQFDRFGHSTPDDVRRIFREADTPDTEALVHVGSGLPVVHLIDELEREHGKPVVACNAACYWQTLRASGIDDRIEGFGRLLARY